jgi:flavodoxin
MRSLVVYHSRYGNTERIAQAIADGLSERGEARAVPLSALGPHDLEHAQLVVLGAPTQWRGIAAPMRRFLRDLPRDAWFARPVAVFDTRYVGSPTRTGSAAAALARRLQAMNALLSSPPESFFVVGGQGPLEEGEVARARIWGRRLHLGDRVTAEGE